MSVKPSDMAELNRLEKLMPPDRNSAEHLAVIETVDELFGFMVADARAAGDDEADACEMLARHAGMTPDEVRGVAVTLKALGYTEASSRLIEIAGRRRGGLRPLR
jgi:hypothetical protein